MENGKKKSTRYLVTPVVGEGPKSPVFESRITSHESRFLLSAARYRLSAFTLVELLVTIGIIGLLVSILLPTLSSSRKAARSSQVKVQLDSIKQALEKFHNETGDYPESAKQRDLTDISSTANDPLGPNRAVNHPGNDTTLYGAQALTRAMMGKDLKGYVDPVKARDFDKTRAPTEWYDKKTVSPPSGYESHFPRLDVLMSEKRGLARTADPDPLVDPGAANDVQLGGVRPGSIGVNNTQFVFIDSFDNPILYYKANPRGTVLCSDAQDANGYATNPPSAIPAIPFYHHLDNDVFTGSRSASTNEAGWQFGTEFHELKELGDPAFPDCADTAGPCSGATPPPAGYSMWFAKYIHDHKTEAASAGKILPVNPDSYLLISTGFDGVYGTSDDINNFPQ